MSPFSPSRPASTLWSMEEVFSDALGLFGGETEEDDGYVHYGGLKLGVVPKVCLTAARTVIILRLADC